MEQSATAGFWLSPQQKHVWSVQSDVAQSGLVAVSAMHISGTVRPESVHGAVRQLVSRHETLRTVFRRQVGMKVPFQVVLESSEPGWESANLSSLAPESRNKSLDDIFRREQMRAVDLEHGPICYATYAELGENESALFLTIPIVCSDRRSLDILFRELAALLAGQQLTVLGDLRYVQFAQWQNDLLESEEEAAQDGRAFWKERTAHDWPVGSLPFETQTSSSELRASNILVSVPAQRVAELEQFATKYDASTSDVFLAAWQCLCHRLDGQTAITTGVVLNDRGYEELENSVGLFAKTVPITAEFDGGISFREVIHQVRDSARKALEWQEYLDPSSSQTTIGFEYFSLPSAQKHGDVTFSMEQQAVWSERFKLKLEVQEKVQERVQEKVQQSGRSLALLFHYDSSRFSRDTIEQWASHFQTLLAAAVAHPDTPVSRLPLLNAEQRQQLLVDRNRSAADYPKLCLHQLFEAQAARTPDRPALRCADQLLSYRQLNERANQFAHHLRSLGVGPDALVALALDRSADLIVALLGVLKAGGAYVPLNPDNPKPRLAQQLHGATVLVTEQKLLAQMPEFAGSALCFDRDAHLWTQLPVSNPESSASPENLVYVLYTSGSTGIPKGVAVRHRNLVNYSHFLTQRLNLSSFPDGLHFATVSTLAADLGNTCIFPSLISGGCLHVLRFEDSTDSQRFARYTQQHPIDVLKIVPSHLQALLSSSEAADILPRQFLITGGETLTPQLLQKIASLNPTCEVFNHYGPTETTIGSLTLRLKDYDWKTSTAASIPLGRPIANTQCYLLDAHLEPVPLGVRGELYIAGDGVTAGYLHQPDKTAERFLKNPFTADATAKMYRTGDLARLGPDGNIEFLGRGDDQVKIRGFRIELGEIEAILSQHPSVLQAVLLARPTNDTTDNTIDDKQLVAYIVARPDPTPSPDALRAHLLHHLPDYMLPSAFVFLPKIPLTPNGKIDRQALPAPDQAPANSAAFVPPSTPTELAVAHIWAEVLRKPSTPISALDNFFHLGGHSLMATQVISRVREHFCVELAMRVLFEHPTILAFSQAVDAAPPLEEDAIVPVSREAYRASK